MKLVITKPKKEEKKLNGSFVNGHIYVHKQHYPYAVNGGSFYLATANGLAELPMCQFVYNREELKPENYIDVTDVCELHIHMEKAGG